MMTPTELAKAKLFENLDEKNKESYDKYGIIKVLGADGITYYVANEEAIHKYSIWRISVREGSFITGYCVDIPLISHEKILVLKLVLETKPGIIITKGNRFLS